MVSIRTITDPREFTLAVLDEIRAGNEATRKKIKRLRGVFKGGLKEEERLESELVEMTIEKGKRNG